MDTQKPEPYDLDELIGLLEDIFNEKDHLINPPKAAYTLALEIKKLKINHEHLLGDLACNAITHICYDTTQSCEAASSEMEGLPPSSP